MQNKNFPAFIRSKFLIIDEHLRKQIQLFVVENNQQFVDDENEFHFGKRKV